jgi:hypothetical protein
MAFNAMCVPGEKSGATVQILGLIQQQPAVVLYLDPDRVVIGPPQSPAEWPEFLRFLRDVRDAVDTLADHLDPQNDSVYYERLVVAPIGRDVTAL